MKRDILFCGTEIGYCKMTYQEYKEKYNIQLDPSQDAACSETGGHVLLLAVPGSGKTSVIIARLGYLTMGLGVDPSSVLAVTYSVSGAREMQKRYEALFGKNSVEIRTINGICSKIIRCYEMCRNTRAFRLLDGDGDVTRIVRDIMTSCGGYPSENEIKDVKTALTYSRNMMLSPDEISKLIPAEGRDFSEIYGRYRDFKRENRLMDYDDQLCYAYKILCSCPDVFDHFSRKYRYIFVDEAQDTSKIQHMIIRRLAEKNCNLFMVGDEDQSIYGFRAAYPDGLMDFDTVYPDAKVMFIEKNYRSTGAIVSAADKFIKLNKLRRDKHMVTCRENGSSIINTKLRDLRDMPGYLLKTAGGSADARYGGNSTAILCRVSDSFLPVIDCFSRNNIPFRIRSGDGLFFTHYIVTDVCRLLRFAVNPFDSELFEQLYYKLSCFIGRTDFEYAVTHNTGNDVLSFPEYIESNPYFKEKTRKRMKHVTECLCRANTLIGNGKCADAIRQILNCGYGSYLAHRTKDMTKISALLFIAEKCVSLNDFFSRLEQLRQLVTLGTESSEGIVLSTIHSAKGMEFDHVILPDCRNGILPSITEPADGKKYTDEEIRQREEDRRLFYVAVTRAKNKLELITYEKIMDEDAHGFDFVTQLLGKKDEKKTPEKPRQSRPDTGTENYAKLIKDFTEGTGVYHKVFGEGIITAVRGTVAEVKFNRYPIPKKIDIITCVKMKIMREI